MKNRINKYLYGYRIYIDYGYGYEYELFELTRQDTKNQVNDYRKNAGHVIKAIKVTRGREINPVYITHCLKSIGVDNTILELKK